MASSDARHRARSTERDRGDDRTHSRQSSRGSSRRQSRALDGFGEPTGPPDRDDFVNSFWGQDGFEALAGVMKRGDRTLEELKAIFKERAAAEEEYAKRLQKISRMPFGRDELGNSKTAFDRILQENGASAEAHGQLGRVIRLFLEAKTRDFESGRDGRLRQNRQNVEKATKENRLHVNSVAKAREKYRNDCVHINGLTAQTALTQGKDLDKIQFKLDKHEQTVQQNRGEYKHNVDALKANQSAYIMQFKSFADLCQDLEEDRLDFTRNVLWEMANCIAFVCVKDDESCEGMRSALETLVTPREVARIAHQRGSGNEIIDPMPFVDFAAGRSDTGPSVRQAAFSRSSARLGPLEHSSQSLDELAKALSGDRPALAPTRSQSNLAPAQPAPQEASTVPAAAPSAAPAPAAAAPQATLAAVPTETPLSLTLPKSADNDRTVDRGTVSPSPGFTLPTARPPSRSGIAAFGAAMARRLSRQSMKGDAQAQDRLEARPYSPAPPAQASQTTADPLDARPAATITAGAFRQSQSRPPSGSFSRSPAPANAELAAPANAELAAPAPAQEPVTKPAEPPASAATLAPAEDDDDPLVARLKSIRANPSPAPSPRPTSIALQSAQSSSALGRAAQTEVPRRATAVDQAGRSASRPQSLAQPFPAPDSRPASRPASPLNAPRRNSQYAAQADPRPVSRQSLRSPNDASQQYRAASPNPARQSYQQQQQTVRAPQQPQPAQYARPPSQQGFARPPSQQGFAAAPSQQNLARPPSQQGFAPAPQGYARPPSSQGFARATSPIVQVPTSASAFAMQQQQQPMTPAQAYAHAASQPQPYPSQAPCVRRFSSPPDARSQSQYGRVASPSSYDPRFAAQPTGQIPASPSYQQGGPQRTATQRAPDGYSQDPRRQSYQGAPYGQPAQQQPTQYGSTPQLAQYSATPQPGQYYQQAPPTDVRYSQTPQPQPQQQQHQSYAPQQSSYSPAPNGYAQQPQPQQGDPRRSQSFYASQPAQQIQRAASPLPPSQQQAQAHTRPGTALMNSEGRPILFYVQAVYDYVATIEEEFSFQKDDIIAVFETAPDGWWQGELLDEQRRRMGGNTFPSNFIKFLE